MAASKPQCINCEKTGLPILPLRYTVLPKTVKATIPAGIAGHRVTDVALAEHKYGLRTLREGWVYLYYEVGARGSQYWEIYQVTADGRLWKKPPNVFAQPDVHPACAQCAIAVPMDIIAIEQPEKCTGKVYIAFSEMPWHEKTRDRYQKDEAVRRARMQVIQPSEWIGSGHDSGGHAIVATQQTIDDVLEYMPGFDPKQLSVLDEKQRFSKDDGSYSEALLHREISRYPLSIRQASPLSASQALVDLMKRVGTIEDEDGGGNPPEHHPPMLLALWDAIGNAHELNGFRNDPVSWLDRYASQAEVGLKVMALNDIDQAQQIVYSREKHGVEDREAMAKEAHAMTALGRPGAQSALAAQRASALASADPARTAQINAYYDDMNWMAANNIPGSYQTRLTQIGRATSAGSASSQVPYTGPYRDEIMNEARSYAKAQPGFHDRDVRTMQTYGWHWYEQRLVRSEIEQFRKPYTKLKDAVYDLQEARSDDVGKWLRAPLLHDTFEDYYCDDLSNATDFEAAVATAIDGLGSTPKGKAIIDDLVTRWDPLQKDSLVWRAVAMNHPAGRAELAKLLASAREHKETPLEEKGVEFVYAAIEKIAKLTENYKKYSELALEEDPKKISPLGAKYKADERDIAIMAAGDCIFEKFRINQLGDFVGEKIIQTLFLQRAGIPKSDALALVRKQAVLEKKSRLEVLQRLKTARSMLDAPRPGELEATKELYQTWNALKAEKDETALKELRMGRIAAIAALCELVNFWHLLSEAKDEDSYIKLGNSALSLCAAVITIAMTPYYGVLKNSVRTMSWKLVGGFLSAGGAILQAWMDARSAGRKRKSGQYDVMLVLYGKATVGVGMSAAFVIDAMSTAAPLFKKLAARTGRQVVMNAVASATEKIAAAAALRAVVVLTSFEGAIVLTVIQYAASCLTPDALESWCSRCAFGTGRESYLRFVKDHTVKRYAEMAEQEKSFSDAMTGVE